jgi:hypothetical protein
MEWKSAFGREMRRKEIRKVGLIHHPWADKEVPFLSVWKWTFVINRNWAQKSEYLSRSISSASSLTSLS